MLTRPRASCTRTWTRWTSAWSSGTSPEARRAAPTAPARWAPPTPWSMLWGQRQQAMFQPPHNRWACLGQPSCGSRGAAVVWGVLGCWGCFSGWGVWPFEGWSALVRAAALKLCGCGHAVVPTPVSRAQHRLDLPRPHKHGIVQRTSPALTSCQNCCPLCCWRVCDLHISCLTIAWWACRAPAQASQGSQTSPRTQDPGASTSCTKA